MKTLLLNVIFISLGLNLPTHATEAPAPRDAAHAAWSKCLVSTAQRIDNSNIPLEATAEKLILICQNYWENLVAISTVGLPSEDARKWRLAAEGLEIKEANLSVAIFRGVLTQYLSSGSMEQLKEALRQSSPADPSSH
jgi:hypothetical protein